ncbi:MAG: carotenoid biosynthesis protein [Methanobacteriaceae archaeon]|jgi:putative membrane protein|nr:carotenoid biosynthesis protein [Methanobacteriaceae archaeon]MDP2837015.1 carotenoid biosynthesis protein [Methanobacteriaceae archaeon]MDP3034813.1 carotenoid biosynthesis protein [Methanobacteriaceae archaeon]MDP3485793.1 carotenoid biosynthesis protein [Methanobacteriaceae archaeon]MDP3624436.1 carotenoid biosynthesis protein [Methanobacteriaceae archaeon]
MFKENFKNFSKLRWSLIFIFLMVNVLLIFTYKNSNLLALDSFLVTALLFILSVFHGKERYGGKNIAIFFLITWAVSFFFENLSIATGFPFGFYHYSPSLGLLTVPLIIIFAYFAIGYLAWMLAHVLTGQYTRKLQGKQVFIVPFIAAFLMVMWDLTVDPISSTLQGLWVWTTPGAYFGVPISNFFGWFLVVYLFFQIFALYLSKYDSLKPEKLSKLSNKPYWMEAVAIYGITALGTILSVFYQYNEITISMALITVFTMIFVALLALVNIMNKKELS